MDRPYTNISVPASTLATPPAQPPEPAGVSSPAPREPARQRRPETDVRPAAAPAGSGASSPRVAAIVVTWNRRDAVDAVLGALSRQDYGGPLQVVVIDNASDDDTAAHLVHRWKPDLIVDNVASGAAPPVFRAVPLSGPVAATPGTRGAIAWLALVRNTCNLGGCGGFNTGLAFLDAFVDRPQQPLDYAWLIDDDVDLPANALRQLVSTAESDPQIGLVGSRTVDLGDRRTTLETTIYFDREQGTMGPDPARGDPRAADHARWTARCGGTRGTGPFSGQRDVDVVPACSLLARWSAVRRVGFWDHRFFIYCDDADWCLRFAAAGYRVVCDLDAVVFHTHWLSRISPVRAYYAQRNLIWVMEKTLPIRRLRRALLRRTLGLLRDAFKAMTHCRLFHAELIRRTVDDAIAGRGGRLDDEGPPAQPLMTVLDQAGALHPDARVLIMCSHPDAIAWADDFRAQVAYELMTQERLADMPRWFYMVRDHVPDPPRANALNVPEPARVVFAPNRRSKWRAQRGFLRRPPTAVVIFDQSNELPILRGRYNVHIDRRRPDQAQGEWDRMRERLRFMGRWSATLVRCLIYLATVRPRPHVGTYNRR